MSLTPLMRQAAEPSDHQVHARTRAGALLKRKGLILGALLLSAFLLVALLAPIIEPDSISRQAGPIFSAPSTAHPLGLDDGGIDMVSLIIAGSRVSLLVAVLSTVLAVLIGGGVGVTAGYFGGHVDGVLMRTTDYFIVVPVLPLMIVVAAVWGSSLSHVIIVIGALQWTATARVMRAQVLSVRQRAFVRRAQAMGAGNVRIIWRHVLPQVRGLLVANAVITVATAIFFESALAFLGLESPDTVSWGTLIEHAFQRSAISVGAWWAIIPPGVCIALVVLACNLIGVSLEDAGNPRILSPHIFRRKLVVGDP